MIILTRIKIWDFDDDRRRLQARRPQVETAGTAILLFTNHDAREYILDIRVASCSHAFCFNLKY